jgi:small subunit ribosomal protein S21
MQQGRHGFVRSFHFVKTRSVNARRECFLQVLVRDNNVDQALRVLKKKMQREGVFREMKRRRFYEKPSEKATREQNEAVRRARKLARKKAQREGLIAAPKPKKLLPGRSGGRGASPVAGGFTRQP